MDGEDIPINADIRVVPTLRMLENLALVRRLNAGEPL